MAIKPRVLVLVVLLFAAAFAFGQAISGDLVGTVVDKSGAVVPNVTIVVTNEATGVKATTTSNASGEYRFNNLLPGVYDITASAGGFGTSTIKGFVVELNKTATARITMQLGQVATTVEVTETTPPIDTTTAQVQTTYEIKQAQDLPSASVGLGVLNLSLLQAGVATTGGLGAGTGPSVGGQRPRNNNFNVEGVDNNDKGVTGPLIYVPNDAVANFTVLQNQFSPEFGHSTGGQFNTVVLSGTNQFHGRAYEYFQNRNLNAIDQIVANGVGWDANGKPLDKLKNPRYDNNRFGGQIGGPVFKNKLFFFANYEYNPIGQQAIAAPIYAPTAAGYTALAGLGAAISQANVNLFKQYATAPTAAKTVPVTGLAGGVEVGIVPVVAPNFTNFKALTTSMDYNLSDKDQIRGRYIYNQAAFMDTGASLPTFFTSVKQPYHLVALSEYHTFSPSVTNEFRVGYNRTGYNYTVPSFSAPGLDAFPNITVDNLGFNLGPSPNSPQYNIQNLYQMVDNLTWIKGNHTMKYGFEARKYISPQAFIQRSRGDYEWKTFDSYLQDVRPNFGERSFGTVGYNGDQYAIYWFVNDTWKLRSNLSLNLGLRYEYTGTPFGWTQQALNSIADVPGLIEFASPQAPKKDFMPRIGFAWSPGKSGNTSIRGGFSMGYDVLYDNIGTLSRPPQIGSTADCPGDCVATGFLANGGLKPSGQTGITQLSQAAARDNTSSYLPKNVKYPYSESWNIGIQRVFKTAYTAEVRYVGTRGVHLNVQNRINIQNIVTPTHSLPTYLQAPSQATLDALTTNLGALFTQYDNGDYIMPAYLNAGFSGPIVGYMPSGASTYHGLQTQLNRRFTNGLQFQAAYTWSHAIDDSTADFFSTVLTPRRQQDFRNLHADRGNSALDRRHRFSISAIYDMPFFKNGNWFVRNILGNNQFSPTYTWQTGEWADVQSGLDSNLNGDSAGDRSIYNANGIPGLGSDVHPLYSTNTCGTLPLNQQGACYDNHTVAYAADYPRAMYISAGYGAVATSGRNTLRMPSTNNWDLSLLKRINITERYRMEFAAQMLNLFNHPQFIGGLLSQVNSYSLASTQDRNYLIPTSDTFNDARGTFSSNPRNIQLSLKFIF